MAARREASSISKKANPVPKEKNTVNRNDTFGINMKQWCREHEAAVTEAIAQNAVTAELLAQHREKIAWLQHERLVHLIVTVMVVIGELFVVSLVLLHPQLGIYPALFMLGVAVLLAFYFYHYFFLENTVQRWYRIAEEMQRQIKPAD